MSFSRGGSNRGTPGRGGRNRGGPSQAGLGQGGPSQAGPSRASPSRASPSRAGPSRAGPSRAGPSQAGSSRAGPSRAGPSQTGLSQTGPSQTGPSQAGPSQAGPNVGNAPLLGPLPVNRRLAYQDNPPVPPLPQTPEEDEERIAALRHQLAYPHMLGTQTLRFHLERNGWDVNRAAAELWWCDDNPTEAPGGRPPLPNLRTGTTVEQERLNQVHDMQTTLRTAFPNRTTNNVEMMLLYHNNDFVPDRAQQEIIERNGAYDNYEAQAASFSQPPDGLLAMDERLALFLNISATNSVYSARQLLQQHNWDVAAAIQDWMQARGVRVTFPPRDPGDQAVENDGLRGVNVNRPPRIRDGQFEFFDNDYEKFQRSKSKNAKGKRKATAGGADSDPSSSDQDSVISGGHSGELDPILSNLSPMSRKRRRTAANRPGGDSEESTESGQRNRGVVAGRDYIRGNRGATGNPRGALVNPNRDPAVVHCPDPTKLYIEYVKEGKYKCLRFKGQARGRRDMPFRWRDMPFRWEDMPDDTVEEAEFDWHDQAHIALLNRWRNDRFVQITGLTKGEPNGGPFNKYEEQWLVEQEAMRIEEKFCDRAGQNQGQNVGRTDATQYDAAETQFDDRANFPIPLSAAELQSLTNRFNSTFMGRRIYRKINWMPDPNNQFRFRAQTASKDMAYVSHVPRPRRTVNEIKQHRCRIAAYSKHFMVSHDKAKWKGVQDESDLVSDVDSDFEEESGRRAALRDPPAAANAGGGSGTQVRAGTQAQTGTGAAQTANVGPSTASGAAQNANVPAQDDDDDDDDLIDYGDMEEDEDLYGPG